MTTWQVKMTEISTFTGIFVIFSEKDDSQKETAVALKSP